MGWPAPRYAHHALMHDATGRRLAKRDGAESLRALREKGFSAAQVLAMVEAG
jgi:glutamyl-Q tRNA(Asp) synthetase